MSKRCCFMWHSKNSCSENEYNNLCMIIEKLIEEEKVSEFWIGYNGELDSFFAEAVVVMKEKYSDIQLNLVLPRLTSVVNRYKEIYSRGYDHILIADVPEDTSEELGILKCNEYMIEKSDFLICYDNCEALKYAKKKNHIKIINPA